MGSRCFMVVAVSILLSGIAPALRPVLQQPGLTTGRAGSPLQPSDTGLTGGQSWLRQGRPVRIGFDFRFQ